MPHELISADSHVNPPPTIWADYLPAEFRERAPRLESTDEGDFQVFEGRRTPILGISSMAGKKPENYSWTVRRLEDQRAGGYDPAERIQDMDHDHVQAEVLYGGGPLGTQDRDLRRASYSAYNDWLADFCAADPRRLWGMAYIPCESPEDAVAEIRRTAAKGLRGCVLPRFPHAGGEFYDPDWDVLWRTLIDVGWPGGIHVGGRGRQAAMPRTDGVGFITDLMMSKFALAEACAQLVVSGVLEKYPELKIVSVEGQLGWISFAQYYLDHVWMKHRHWTGNELKRPPSEYFKRQVYATFMEDPVGLRERHEIGVENIMWSSDYPHSETTWPDSKKLTDEWFDGFPEDERRKIVFENAQRLYGG
ncbi:MAG: amidohydrolase [Proteobacteria bacterium]|nr:amidohydrolase [Pseudomonadota bacterium]